MPRAFFPTLAHLKPTQHKQHAEYVKRHSSLLNYCNQTILCAERIKLTLKENAFSGFILVNVVIFQIASQIIHSQSSIPVALHLKSF